MFLDSSQYVLLRLVSIFSLFGALVSFCALITEITFFIRKLNRMYLGMFTVSLTCFFFNIILTFTSRIVLLISNGVSHFG